MKPIITITDAEFLEASRLAQATIQIFENRLGHYNNTFNSHLRGKLGEIACERWLTDNGIQVDSLFRDSTNIAACDIVARQASKLRLDIKTWDNRYWHEMGRCVAVNQMAKLQAKADGIIWCLSSSKLEIGVTVEIAGWNTIADIESAPRRLTGPANKRQVYNIQVDPEQVRDVLDLIKFINIQ